MIKGVLSQLTRKLSVRRDNQVEGPAFPEPISHPDLEPPSEWIEPQTELVPRTTPTVVRLELDAAVAAGAEIAEDWLHPDLQLMDPVLVAQVLASGGPPLEHPITPTEPPASKEQKQHQSLTELAAELEAEKDVRLVMQKAEPGAAAAFNSADFNNIADDNYPAEVCDKDDEFAEEKDGFAEQEGNLWEVEPLYDFCGEADGGGDLFDSDFGELLEIDSQEIEAEKAEWENLLDLDIDEDISGLQVGHLERDIPEDGQLDDYAARLVSQMHSIKLTERVRLHSRFKAILAEFPYPASYRAMTRQVNAGIGLEALEDACEIKCLWREAPWLWLDRRFNKLQRAWEIKECCKRSVKA